MLASPTTPSNLSTQVPQGYVMRSIYNSIIINSTINSYKKIYKTEFMPHMGNIGSSPTSVGSNLYFPCVGRTHGWVLPQTGVGGTHRWVLPQTDEVGVWDTHGCVGHTGGCSHRLRRWRWRWVRGTHGWVLPQTGMGVGSNLYVRGWHRCPTLWVHPTVFRGGVHRWMYVTLRLRLTCNVITVTTVILLNKETNKYVSQVKT